MTARLALAVAVLVLASGCASGAPAEPATATSPPGVDPDIGNRLPTPADCAAGRPDSDGDGMSDACEVALASAFAPLLMQDPADCEWTDTDADGRIAGGYFHAVQTTGSGHVRIAYLPAYLTDCGWDGAKCLLPGVDCRPHAGDTEAIVLEVRHDAGSARWAVASAFLSAHCFDGEARSCRWREGTELDGFGWTGDGAPIVWVASGRHANYPSRTACDRGHFLLDTCPPDPRAVRFPVSADRNLGSAAAPIGGTGCVTAPPDLLRPAVAAAPTPNAPSPAPNGGAAAVLADAVECFWEPRPFRGWQGDEHPGVTPYHRYLTEIAGF